MFYPTDLSPAEQTRARARLVDLAERFTAAGHLCSPRWREVFERTWRHPDVPGYYPDKDSRPVTCLDPSRRGEWLDARYSGTTLVVGDGAAGHPRARR